MDMEIYEKTMDKLIEAQEPPSLKPLVLWLMFSLPLFQNMKNRGEQSIRKEVK
jgi:hypothetical protein